MNILGIILARGGSKEVPRKNLLKIGGKTLVELAIQSANESEFLSRTIFSTDDLEIFKVAESAGAYLPFLRPSDLAQDNSSTFSVVKHAVDWLKSNEDWKADIIVILQPTTPFRTGKHIDDVIQLMIKENADSAITVKKPDYPPFWMLELDSNQKLTNIIKDGNKFLRRQDTPEVYQPAGLVYALSYELLKEMDTLLPSGDTCGLIVPENDAINIDTQMHYELAKIIYKNNE
jgi:CMP-N,N'-diacetyllegionaminic acid synthase